LEEGHWPARINECQPVGLGFDIRFTVGSERDSVIDAVAITVRH
jgi:hypothetical protein